MSFLLLNKKSPWENQGLNVTKNMVNNYPSLILKSAYASMPCSARSSPLISSSLSTLSPVVAFTIVKIIKEATTQNAPTIPTPIS